MELNSTLGESDYREFIKMSSMGKQWLVADILALFMAMWILWDPICINLLSPRPNWRGDALAFIILVIGSLCYLWSKKLRWKQEMKQLNDQIYRFIVNDAGVEWQGPNGARQFLLWSRFQSWRKGRRVLLLEKNGAGNFILPLTDLSGVERQEIRSLVQSHIPYKSSAR